MSTERNKTLVRRLTEIVNAGDLSTLPGSRSQRILSRRKWYSQAKVHWGVEWGDAGPPRTTDYLIR